MDYPFKDLVNLDKINEMFHLFYQATGIIISIVDHQGCVLVSTPWRSICSLFHRTNPHTNEKCLNSDINFSTTMNTNGDKFNIYECGNGLIDAAAPIIIQGKHVATIYTGQVFLEKPNMQYFREQANKNQWDESAYMEALWEVPIIKKEKLIHVMNFLCSFAEILGEMGLKEIKQIQAQKEVLVAKEELEVSQKILIAAFEELRDQYDKEKTF